jgi:hypothetical protein
MACKNPRPLEKPCPISNPKAYMIDRSDFEQLEHRLKLLPFQAKRAEFYQDFAEMFRRNEAMMSFLEGEIHNSMRTGQASRALALKLILRRYRAGGDAGRISHLLGGVMPKSDAMLLVGVDQAEDKSAALLSLARAVQTQSSMKKIAWGYSLLPLIMLPLCYLLVLLMGRVIFELDKGTPPELSEQLWQGLNGAAKMLATFIREHGLASILGFLGLLALIIHSLPRWRGQMRLRLEGWPIYSLYRDFQSGLLFSSMAMLLQTGGTLRGALEDIAQRSSRWMRWHIGRILIALDRNPNHSLDAFSRGLISPHLHARAATLLRTADSFADVLIELGTKEEARVLARVRTTAILANAALIAVLLSLATLMAVACITAPGRFANLNQAGSIDSLRYRQTLKTREAELQQQTQAASEAGSGSPNDPQ